MLNRQADVFVEMEKLDARPVDAWRGGERIEKRELRRAGRGNDPRPRARAKGVLDHACRRVRRGAAHRDTIGVNLDLHG